MLLTRPAKVHINYLTFKHVDSRHTKKLSTRLFPPPSLALHCRRITPRPISLTLVIPYFSASNIGVTQLIGLFSRPDHQQTRARAKERIPPQRLKPTNSSCSSCAPASHACLRYVRTHSTRLADPSSPTESCREALVAKPGRSGDERYPLQNPTSSPSGSRYPTWRRHCLTSSPRSEAVSIASPARRRSRSTIAALRSFGY